MGDKTADEDIEEEAYVSVELNLNQSIVNIRRKRLILKSHRDIFSSAKDTLRKSRSRSTEKEPTKSSNMTMKKSRSREGS